MCYRVTNEELRRGELIEINKRSFSQVTGSDAGSLAFSVSEHPCNYIIYNSLLINSIQYRIITSFKPLLDSEFINIYLDTLYYNIYSSITLYIEL